MLSRHLMNNRQNIVREKLNGHGQKDDTEELPQHIDDVGAQPMADFVEIAQHDVVNDDIECQPDHDVHRGVLRMKRDEGGDGTGSGDEGEGDGNDAGTR